MGRILKLYGRPAAQTDTQSADKQKALESELAALKKELAALKKQIAKLAEAQKK